MCPCHRGNDAVPVLRYRDGRWECGKALDEWQIVEEIELLAVMSNIALMNDDVVSATTYADEAWLRLWMAKEKGLEFPYHEDVVRDLLEATERRPRDESYPAARSLDYTIEERAREAVRE